MLFPQRIDLDEESISQLRDLYNESSNDLKNTILKYGPTITVASSYLAKQLIRQRIHDLAVAVANWAEGMVQEAYDTGQSDCIDELQSFNNPITDRVAAAILSGGVALDELHKNAAQSIALDLQQRLNDAVTQMQSSAEKTIGQMLRDSISNKFNEGDKAVRKTILETFDENGIYSLVDRAGKRWDPAVYADMVARTNLSQAHNAGISNSLTSIGYDLVQISAHGAGDACREWEDAIVSLNGDTPGFFTIDDAQGAGCFHVNCQHTFSPIDPSDAGLTMADIFADSTDNAYATA